MTPERLGPFLLYERLSGLAGEAYRARRVVAAGQLSASFVVERFRAAPSGLAAELSQAAEWGARVAHPGVVRVLEVGLVDGTLYSVSELAEGADLATVLSAASPGEGAPSVPAALAIAAQLAQLARQVHEEAAGREPLGLFRPGDVVLGYDGRVRVRARGVVERPGPGEGRDPFLAPELARGAPLEPAADVWTVARVLRAVLAMDPLGKKTPKVSTLYKDSLGAILTGALARDPSARLSMRALESRLLEVALADAADLTTPVVELLEEHAGGALPLDDDALGFDEGRALAVPGPASEVLFPRHASGTASPTGTFAGPRVELSSDEGEDDVSLEAVAAAGDDVRLGSAAALLDALDDDDDVDDALDLDAIARSSLEGQAPLEDPLAGAGTAVIARPEALPSEHDDGGDVFQPSAPATKVARLSTRERSSLEARARARAPVKTVELPAQPASALSPADVFAPPRVADDDNDVFTATLKPSELLSGLTASPGPDPDKTAYLDNPASAFKSAAGRPAVRPLTDVPSVDDDEQPTERLSADLVREAVRLARQASVEQPEQPEAAEEPEEPEEPTRPAAAVLDDELGRLVIDVPEGAVVFVNGEQRGQGRTTLDGLDRFASFVVRVHHRGHLPWTGTVTLRGMEAARIEPELTRRI